MDEAFFAGRLLPGERILWTGRPSGGILFTGQDVFMVPFSLAWCGFAIFWTTSASQESTPGFFTLWGAMFVLVGMFFVFGRFLADAWVRSGVRYALTDQRVLISRSAPFSNFAAVGLAQLPDLQLSERGGGSGTIRFGSSRSPWQAQNWGLWMPSLAATPQFLAIADARRVFDMVQQAAAKAGRPGA
jgi:hypothetical protein